VISPKEIVNGVAATEAVAESAQTRRPIRIE
jgi:hypothetical protein